MRCSTPSIDYLPSPSTIPPVLGINPETRETGGEKAADDAHSVRWAFRS